MNLRNWEKTHRSPPLETNKINAWRDHRFCWKFLAAALSGPDCEISVQEAMSPPNGGPFWRRLKLTMEQLGWQAYAVLSKYRSGLVISFGAITAVTIALLALAVFLVGYAPDMSNALAELVDVRVALLLGLFWIFALWAVAWANTPLNHLPKITAHQYLTARLNAALTHLAATNMNVQIGNIDKFARTLGNYSPLPEGYIRHLDSLLETKEAINSFESTIRARMRHVEAEVQEEAAEHAKLTRRLRGAAVTVGASFVVLEIGQRVQDFRDLRAGTDPKSYFYWLKLTPSDATAAAPGGLQTGTGAGTQAAANAEPVTPAAALNACVEGAPTRCLADWRGQELQSSTQIVLATLIVAVIFFAVSWFSSRKTPPPS